MATGTSGIVRADFAARFTNNVPSVEIEIKNLGLREDSQLVLTALGYTTLNDIYLAQQKEREEGGAAVIAQEICEALGGEDSAEAQSFLRTLEQLRAVFRATSRF